MLRFVVGSTLVLMLAGCAARTVRGRQPRPRTGCQSPGGVVTQSRKAPEGELGAGTLAYLILVGKTWPRISPPVNAVEWTLM
jgi:hypothetical protein